MSESAKLPAICRAHAGNCNYRGVRQRGVALVMCLMILLILTILGVTAMGTSSLQEKMAGNTQEGTKAFEVAESGLMSTFNNPANFSLTAPTTTPPFPINGRVARVTTTFLQATEVPRSIGGFDTTYNAYHFRQGSEVKGSLDSANLGLNTSITRGVTQISKKSN